MLLAFPDRGALDIAALELAMRFFLLFSARCRASPARAAVIAADDHGFEVQNSVNLVGKKNWIGTFAVPWAVVNDTALLATLPDRDFRCGFSEAVLSASASKPKKRHAAKVIPAPVV